MSKTSRIILWCVLIAVLAMCIALYIAAKRPIEDTAYRNAGKTYTESQQPGDEAPVITGGDFTITAHTFENMCTQNRASGMTEDACWASMFETRKLMLTLESYTQAQKAAFPAAGHTRDEADAWHDFCYALTKAAVDAQNITLAAPYTWTLTRDNYNTAGTWPELTQSAGTPG